VTATMRGPAGKNLDSGDAGALSASSSTILPYTPRMASCLPRLSGMDEEMSTETPVFGLSRSPDTGDDNDAMSRVKGLALYYSSVTRATYVLSRCKVLCDASEHMFVSNCHGSRIVDSPARDRAHMEFTEVTEGAIHQQMYSSLK